MYDGSVDDKAMFSPNLVQFGRLKTRNDQLQRTFFYRAACNADAV